MLHKSNFRFRVGVPRFSALFLSNLGEYRRKSYIAENYIILAQPQILRFSSNLVCKFEWTW